jgi:hypothetical protein
LWSIASALEKLAQYAARYRLLARMNRRNRHKDLQRMIFENDLIISLNLEKESPLYCSI